MVDKPEPTPEEAAFLETRAHAMALVGGNLGAINVQLLGQVWTCGCMGCQLDSAVHLIRWCVHGEDMRAALPLLEDFIRNIFDVRREMKAQLKFAEATHELGVSSQPAGRA